MPKKILPLLFIIASAAMGGSKPMHGPYINGNIGFATGPVQISINSNEVPAASQLSTTLSNFGLGTWAEWGWGFALGWNLPGDWAIEANYTHWAHQSLETTTAAVSTAGGFTGYFQPQTLVISGIKFIPIRNSDYLFAKLGIGSVFGKLVIHDPLGAIFAITPGEHNITHTQFAMVYGFGVQFAITQKLYGKGEWNHLTIGKSGSIGNISGDLFTLGLNYLFTL